MKPGVTNRSRITQLKENINPVQLSISILHSNYLHERVCACDSRCVHLQRFLLVRLTQSPSQTWRGSSALQGVFLTTGPERKEKCLIWWETFDWTSKLKAQVNGKRGKIKEGCGNPSFFFGEATHSSTRLSDEIFSYSVFVITSEGKWRSFRLWQWGRWSTQEINSSVRVAIEVWSWSGISTPRHSDFFLFCVQ